MEVCKLHMPMLRGDEAWRFPIGNGTGRVY